MKEHQNLFRDLQEDLEDEEEFVSSAVWRPTAAINATLAGVIKQAIKEEQIDQVYGLVMEFRECLEQKFVNLTEKVDTEKSWRS